MPVPGLALMVAVTLHLRMFLAFGLGLVAGLFLTTLLFLFLHLPVLLWGLGLILAGRLGFILL